MSYRPSTQDRLAAVSTLVRSGVLRPSRPDKTVRQLGALAKWGPTIAAGYLAAAAHSPRRVAVIDERDEYTFAQLVDRSTRLAHGLAAHGVQQGSRVAVLCRNHAGALQALIAAAFLGADVVLVNTGLSAVQTVAAITDHDAAAVIADEEFVPTLGGLPPTTAAITAWHDHPVDGPTLDDLIASAPSQPLAPPTRAGRVIVLTSGTTGVPKGARRRNPPGLSAAAAVLSRIPLRLNETVLLSAPLFHTWGFAAVQLGMPLHATLVMRRRFDPEEALRDLDEHRCTAMFVVPVMLQRIMELSPEVRARYDTRALRIIASSGSAVPAPVVVGALQAFGDVLYNLYGSTEVSWASIADPADLRADPTTAGRPPLGTRIAILDEDGRTVPIGRVGSIFVGNDMLFEGYTSQRGRDRVSPATASTGRQMRDGLMRTGDRGYVDAHGRLFVSGRDDDMIVSGGENVFPREVEDVIAGLPGVLEVAVVGVPDAEFGQRFAAFVVPAPRARLDAEQVKTWVRGHLARFSVPRDVVFLTALPRNATGKVLRRDLHLSDPVADGSGTTSPFRPTAAPPGE